jgi:large subunit ribosomal protein L24
MKIHTGDTVAIIAGKDKGKKGKVLAVNRETERVVVEGAGIATKHIKRSGNTPGQIVKVERAIHVSNVSAIDPETKKPTRVGYRIEGTKKVRFAKKSGKTL